MTPQEYQERRANLADDPRKDRMNPLMSMVINDLVNEAAKKSAPTQREDNGIEELESNLLQLYDEYLLSIEQVASKGGFSNETQGNINFTTFMSWLRNRQST